MTGPHKYTARDTYAGCHFRFAEIEGRLVYVFSDHGVILERGEASSPRVIAVLFDEFCRWRATVDREPT